MSAGMSACIRLQRIGFLKSVGSVHSKNSSELDLSSSILTVPLGEASFPLCHSAGRQFMAIAFGILL